MGDLSRINTNVAALRAFLTLNTINSDIIKFQEQISTGKNINRASDDPAGYFAARVLDRDIQIASRSILQLERGINFLQNNSSKLNTVADILLEIAGLASQANSGAVSSAEKSAIQLDINGLVQEIQSILNSGVSARIYSGFTLGNLEGARVSGSNGLAIPSLASLTIDGTNLQVTGTNADAAIANARAALESILTDNQALGSYIRRLEFNLQDSQVTVVDLRAQLSTIQDADLAEVQLDLTRAQILQQTALAMLAQANAAPQSILVLFGG